MNYLKLSTAQFEHPSGDKNYNLSLIEMLSKMAAKDGSKVIFFLECSITGYIFARHLYRFEMLHLAEEIPDGDSIIRLTEIAEKYNIVILAGLFEKDKKDNLFNTYVCIDQNGIVAKYRKIHPFINPFISPGNKYCVILICYDNNIVENVRATKLLGAEIIFMPHVTLCTPYTRPGAGFVDPSLWKNRKIDPISLHLEFDRLKGRAWLIKWLLARADDNSVFVIFSNPIGMDDDQLKNGCSMILDPFRDILAECRTLGDDLVSAVLSSDKIEKAGGHRYTQARRPSLYRHILGKKHNPEYHVA
ncbi:nitrilase-related carbon-nitrogen hydrolase [Salegentibacter sp. F14]